GVFELDGALDGGDDLAISPGAVRVEHAQVDDVGVRGHAEVLFGISVQRILPVTGDDAGYMRAMAILVVRAGITGNKPFPVDDPRLVAEWELKIVVVVNATVDDGDSDPGAVYGILLASEVAQDRGRRIIERRLVRPVGRDIRDVGMLLEPRQRACRN